MCERFVQGCGAGKFPVQVVQGGIASSRVISGRISLFSFKILLYFCLFSLLDDDVFGGGHDRLALVSKLCNNINRHDFLTLKMSYIQCYALSVTFCLCVVCGVYPYVLSEEILT